MRLMGSQITDVSIIYSTVGSGADQRKSQSSASLAFMRGIRRWPVNSQHKGPVTRKMFPFDEVIMYFKNTRHCPARRCFSTETWVRCRYSCEDLEAPVTQFGTHTSRTLYEALASMGVGPATTYMPGLWTKYLDVECFIYAKGFSVIYPYHYLSWWWMEYTKQYVIAGLNISSDTVSNRKWYNHILWRLLYKTSHISVEVRRFITTRVI